MNETIAKWLLALLGSSIALIQPTFPFIFGIVLVTLLDCISAYRLSVRVKKEHPHKSIGNFESKKGLKVISMLGWVYIILLVISYIEAHVLQDTSYKITNWIAAIFCFMQLISVLENESSCKGAWWAKVLQKFLKDKTERHFEIKIDKLKKDAEKEIEKEDKKKYGDESK